MKLINYSFLQFWKLVVLLLVLVSTLSHAQGPAATLEVSASGNCFVDSVRLEAKTNGRFVRWETVENQTSVIATPLFEATWVRQLFPTTYQAVAEVRGENLILNLILQDLVVIINM